MLSTFNPHGGKMDLDEYMWRHKRTLREFSKTVGCTTVTLCRIKHRTQTPRMPLAMKIERETEGQVSLQEMVSKRDTEKLEKWFGK